MHPERDEEVVHPEACERGCQLFHQHVFGDRNVSLMSGAFAASPFRLRDTEHREGAFFVFPDLSIRMEGYYRFKFVLYEIVLYVGGV